MTCCSVRAPECAASFPPHLPSSSPAPPQGYMTTILVIYIYSGEVGRITVVSQNTGRWGGDIAAARYVRHIEIPPHLPRGIKLLVF